MISFAVHRIFNREIDLFEYIINFSKFVFNKKADYLFYEQNFQNAQRQFNGAVSFTEQLKFNVAYRDSTHEHCHKPAKVHFATSISSSYAQETILL